MKKTTIFFIVILVIAMSATGFITSLKFLAKPPTEEHMQQLAKVAEEVSEVGYKYEIPENINISYEDGIIYVRSDSFNERGVVKCLPMENGDTTFVYAFEADKTLGAAMISAAFFAMLTLAGSILIYEKISKRKAK